MTHAGRRHRDTRNSPLTAGALATALLLLAGPAACTSAPDGKITQLDVQPLDQVDTGRAADADAVPLTDLLNADADELRFDVVPLDADLADSGPVCEPGTGCFLDPCTANDQCLSGWCVEHLGDGVCTMTCLEECPAGWECQPYGGSGQDLMFACVSLFTNLCKPCTAAADCISPGGIQDACVSYPGGSAFCGGACGPDVECPEGFTCAEVVSVSGVPLTQCVPASGECECSAKSVALGLATDCSVTNELGTCTGKRVCTADGLSPCDAPEPAGETCNGIDDDCDGQVDEPLDLDGVPISLCNDDNPCTKDVCGGPQGCSNPPLDGTECQDGNLCTTADHCQDGLCVGIPMACDDDNPCTDDSCGQAGKCVHEPNADKCYDGNPCTVADQCQDSACVGVPVDCDCQEDSDCIKLEDGDLCNGILVCDLDKFPHVCAVKPGTAVECPPPAGDFPFCLQTQCQPETGSCLTLPAHEGFACDDGNACTLGDACQEGTCAGKKPANCADDNPCTDDSCLAPAGCQHTPNSAPCSDGDACTLNDICNGGACAGGPDANCDDANPCTDDGCHPLSGCTHAANSDPCDDANACTTGDACQGGVCLAGKAVGCDDQNLCTDDTCDPKSGCIHAMNSAPCDDGSVCTLNDKCEKGSCVGSAPFVCEDSNPCTDDQCHPKKGCLFVPNSKPCDDANACTVGDTCDAGLCKSKSMLDCDDLNPCTSDSCDPATGCLHAANTAPCDDADACTLGDVCDLGACKSGSALDCDDSNPCTDDSCNPKSGCKHVTNALDCDDGNACTVDDKCDGGKCKSKSMLSCSDENPCTTDSCNPAVGCLHVINSAPCDDGDVCTTADKCIQGICAGTGLLSCDDGNPCTQDSCAPGVGCASMPFAEGQPCEFPGICAGTCAAGICKEGAVETCDGKDNDCDSKVDETGAAGCNNAWHDIDGDGFGAGLPSCECGIPDGFSATKDDCDDQDKDIHPKAVDACNGADDNCDGILDPEGAAGCKDFLLDGDGDSFGKVGDSKCLCKGSAPYTALVGGDCADNDAAVNPGAIESCSTPFDDNCDGKTNDGCVYKSCKEILAMTPAAVTGKYTIDPDGNGPVAPYPVWCEMSADGGGWTLAGVAANSGTRRWNSIAVFSDTSTFGSVDQLTAAFKSPAWKQLAGDDFLVDTGEYAIGYHALFGGKSVGDYIAGKWPGGCASTWLHGTPEFSSNLTADQVKLFGFTLRGWDDNADCFPNSNENSAISLFTAECCWVNGIGNNTCCNDTWGSHDHSMLKKQFLVTFPCNPAQWPCSPGGVTVNAYNGGTTECYDASCKTPWVRMYVR